MSTALAAPDKVGKDPITTALVAAGVTSAIIEQLAKDFGELAKRTEPIETPEEYEVIKRAQLAHRDVRTAVTAALKIERDEAHKYQKFVLSEEKRILAIIEATEGPLKKLREDYDNREMLRQQAEAKAWAEKMQLRKEAVFDAGFSFNGSVYLCSKEDGTGENWVLAEEQITGMAMNEATLFSFLDTVKEQLRVTREVKAEAEAKAQEERDKAEAAQKAEAERIAAAQAELERKQKEMEAREKMLADREMNTRLDMLRGFGGVEYPDGNVGFGGNNKTKNEVLAMSIDDYDAWLSVIDKEAKAWHAAEAERKAKEEKERLAREEQMKAEAAQRAVEAERLRVAQEQEAKEKAEALAAEQEKEKALLASDKEKIIAFGTKLAHLTGEIPALKSAIGQHAMKTLTKQISDIVTMLAKLEL